MASKMQTQNSLEDNQGSTKYTYDGIGNTVKFNPVYASNGSQGMGTISAGNTSEEPTIGDLAVEEAKTALDKLDIKKEKPKEVQKSTPIKNLSKLEKDMLDNPYTYSSYSDKKLVKELEDLGLIHPEELTTENVIEYSRKTWASLAKEDSTYSMFSEKLTDDQVVDLYLKRSPAIVEYIRILLIQTALNVDIPYAKYSVLKRDRNPIIQTAWKREAEAKYYKKYAEAIKILVSRLNIPEELTTFCMLLATQSIDLRVLDNPVLTESEKVQYFIDYTQAVLSFHEIAKKLRCNPLQQKVWWDKLGTQLLRTAKVEYHDIQILTKKELEKYSEQSENFNLTKYIRGMSSELKRKIDAGVSLNLDSADIDIRYDIITLFATWYVTIEAMEYKKANVRGLTIEQMINYPVPFDISHIITEAYLAELSNDVAIK